MPRPKTFRIWKPRLLEALQELLRGLHPSFQRADESAKALVVGGQVANLQALLYIDILTRLSYIYYLSVLN